MKTIKNKLALIISALSSPFLVIPLFSLLTINYYSTGLRDCLLLGSVFVGFSVLLPLLYILYLIKKRQISDIHVAIREQRSAPFVLAIIGSTLVLVLFNLIGAPKQLVAMSWALFINGVVFALFTNYWKVSMHAASYASSITIVGILITSSWFWLYLLVIFIFWARLVRKRHNFWQLLFATVASPTITALVLILLK